MKPNRFSPSRVCVPDQLEEVLLRIVLARPESPVPVLVYLVSLCRRLKPTKFPAAWLDLPLSRLADIVQEILAAQKPLSSHSVIVYLDELRYQLRRALAPIRKHAEASRARESRSRVRWGDLTLRDFLGEDAEAGLEELVRLAAIQIGGVGLRWPWRKVFEAFVGARYKDVWLFIQRNYGLEEPTAKELARQTLERVRRRLSKFDPKRARLMAFTIHEAKLVVRDYWKQLTKLNAREQSLEGTSEGHSALEHFLPEPIPPEPNRDVTAAKLWLTRLLFRIGKPPHQLIVFILCRLLTVSPSKILVKYPHLTLRQVADITERKYLRKNVSGEVRLSVIRAGFAKLRARMNQPLGQLVGGPKHLAALGPLAKMRAGDVRLRDYFPGSTAASKAQEIVEAWNSVKKTLVTKAWRRWFRRKENVM